MAALIAPGIARYTVHGTFAGRQIANVFDYLITDDVPAARGVNVAEMANVLCQAWQDHILENVADNYVANSVSWVDLNTAEGTVGSTTTGITTNFPQAGTAVGQPMPGNVAIRVNKSISAQRGQRQGRLYLVAGLESYTDDATPNTLSAAAQTSINADLATFLAQANVDVAEGFAWQSLMVVLHTVNNGTAQDPDIVYNGNSIVSSLVCDPTIGSQRRRLRG